MTEWKTYKLRDVCDLIAGFAFKSNHFGNYTHQVIKIADIQPPIIKKELMGVDLSAYDINKLKKYMVSKGDFVLAMTGATIGKIGRITNDTEAYINQRVLTFRPNTSIIDKSYLYYLLTIERFNKYILNHLDSETAQPNISANSIGGYDISLPPLAEQKRIADILGAIDDKIELNRRINANLEQQAQALYKSWFVDFEPFGGKMPEDWKEDIASNYYDITIGKTPPRKETQWFSKSQKDRVWISISDMGKNGMFLGHSTEYITQSAIDKFNIVIVPDKTVLLSFKLTVGRVVISEGEVTTNEAIAHFKTKDKNLLEYTYLTLKNYEFASLGSTSSIATAVNSKTIKSMPWIMPNYDLVKQFHMQTEPLFNIIQKNEKENNNLSTLRETLLPKLMSGEIKV